MRHTKSQPRPVRETRDYFGEAIEQAMRTAPPVTPEQRRRIQSLLAGAR